VTPPLNDWEYTLSIINRYIQSTTGKGAADARDPASQEFVFRPAPVPGSSMPGFSTLMEGNLESWITTQLDRPPLPIFELTPPENLLGRVVTSESSFGQNLQRRTGSGILELRVKMPQGRPLTAPTVPFLDGVIRIASNEDLRIYSRSSFAQSATMLSEVRSSLAPQNLPVIGPGGRVTVYAEEDGVQVDIVVRHREKEIPASWRTISDIAERVRRRISQQPSTEIQGNFGYYELSKYARQTYLRPTFVFLLDIVFRGNENDANVSWREPVVIAASTAPGLPITEGLAGGG